MQTPYALLLATAFITSGALAQAPVTLTKPDAAFPDPYTRVASVRELPNGKLIIADLQDKTVQMLDFATGQATRIGREGQGPGEYALPAGLLAMPNGETWINDLLGRRFLVLDPTGKPTKTVALPGTGGGPGGMAIGFGGTTSDQAGRVYFQAPPFNIGNPDAKAPDSLAILLAAFSSSLMKAGMCWAVAGRAVGSRVAFAYLALFAVGAVTIAIQGV